MRPKSRDDFAIAIICALNIEADAVEALFDERYDRLGKQKGDANAYVNGRIGEHDVVLCYMPGMGKGNAASVASSLLVSYTGIKLALVIGICGGAPSPPDYREIFLGDVIISDSVIEYDFGRQYPSGFRRKTDVKDILGRPNREIRALINSLRGSNGRSELQNRTRQHLHTLQQKETRWNHPGISDMLFKASYLHKHHCYATAECSCLGGDSPDEICEEALGKDCGALGCDKGQEIQRQEKSKAIQPSIYIGPVASADTVMKSGQHLDEIVRREKVIGFEMEGPGVWDNVPCIIIKGVCDYADSHKNKLWQAYAAATGASAAKAFLEYWMPANDKDASKDRHVIIPFARNLDFVGRQDEIHRLEDWISMPDGPRKLAITGLGGVGKTQVALELAYRIRDREPECSIFWIPCISYETIEQACTAIAQEVGFQDANPAELKELLNAYFRRTNGKWLLIFDNADDMDIWTKDSNAASALTDSLPSNAQGHVIFTTRNRKVAVKLASSHVIHVPELDKKTGIEFVGKYLVQKSLIHDHQAVVSLLQQLTFLPLAVTQAAAYINENGIEVSDYLSLLQQQEGDVMELLSEDFGDDGRYKDVQNPVAMTWLVSFQQVQKLDPLAAEYLSLMACVDPRNIPESFLPLPESRKKMVDALGLLYAYSFTTPQHGDRSITLHRLVHLATRNWLRKNRTFSAAILKTAEQLQKVFPDSEPCNREVWRKYLPHALALMGESYFQAESYRYQILLQNVGKCLISDARYVDAEKVVRGLMEIRHRYFGRTDISTLSCMSWLAFIYRKQRKWKEAEMMFATVVGIEKQELGSKHLDTLLSMHNLASVYWDQNESAKAAKLELQVIRILKQIPGREARRRLLAPMNTFGSIYESQQQLPQAERLKMQVVQRCKEEWGPEHTFTLTSMANLASTYSKQGRWKEQQELMMQVMESQERKLGLEHPDTLTTMCHLASIYCERAKWKEAYELEKQVMQPRKRVLGPKHRETLSSMRNLAYASKFLGNTNAP
ncbi:hypothetical protein DTO271G3_5333 [Paecilomyces variotii]|nr:hypothetical protein DTO271G3_5333 [Paecilomyces variotii]